ncbi:MAG: phage Gp37/Gp68 family protein [Chloroflexota bacterium]|nr:phage Gp37/Gp68 family protein [Chloroflexota bacterium]
MSSTIEWTDETWNPVTGCTRVSPGCDNCYMFALYPRLRGMGVVGYDAAPDKVQLMPARMTAPLSWKKPRYVFVNSMSDVFHPDVPFKYVYDMFAVMDEAASLNGHVFQILTKRPGRAVGWWNEYEDQFPNGWHPNIWIGTSVENQKYAPRLTVLARLPAPIRFVSAEPLLGSLDLMPWLEDGTLQWVIAGGESGPRARPMNLDWARELDDQCAKTGVPFFLKQLGGRHGKRSGIEATLDGRLRQDRPETPERMKHAS